MSSGGYNVSVLLETYTKGLYNLYNTQHLQPNIKKEKQKAKDGALGYSVFRIRK